MMPSEIKEMKNKIRELQEEMKTIGAVILQDISRVINTSKCLTEEQKTLILDEIWKYRS